MCRCMRFAFLTIVLVPLFACTSQHSVAQAVSKYIQAYQKGDYKTVIDLADSDQQQIRTIKAQNPKSLWPKLVSDYYSRRTSELARGGPGLFRPNCKWAITEKRPSTTQGWSGQVIPITTTYVNFSYPSMADSPIDGARLKQIVLAFTVANQSGLLLSVTRVGAGDVFWPIPPLTNDEARELALNEMSDTALHLHVALPPVSPAPPLPSGTPERQKWVAIHYPWGGSHRESVLQELVIYRQFLEQNGFTVGQFDESPMGQGKKVPVIVPTSWLKYQLRGSSRQYPGWNMVFSVDENTDVVIENLAADQNSGIAKATVKLMHSGCNTVCTFIHDAVKNRDFMSDCCDGAASFGVRGNNHWGLFDREAFVWPDTEEGHINYVFDQVALKWKIPVTDYLE